MILARAPHELQEQEVAYLQDCIINQPGFINRRGALQGMTAISSTDIDSNRPIAVCTVTDPAGVQKIGLLYWKVNGGTFDLWMAVYTTALVFIQKHVLLTGVPYGYPVRGSVVQCTPAIDGSVIISVRARYDRASTAVAYTGKWYGGCSTVSQTTIAPFDAYTMTEGSTTVVGLAAAIAKVSFPGTVMIGYGVVASVTDATHVELVYPAPRAFAGNISYSTVEALAVARARGSITCTAGVLTGITGYGTKFTESNDRATIAVSYGFQILDPTTMKSLAELVNNAPPTAASDTLTGTPTTVFRSASLKNYLMYGNPTASLGPFNYHPIFSSGNPFSPRSARGSWFTSYKGFMVSFNGLATSFSGSDAGDFALTARAYIHGPRFPEIMDHSVADGDWFDVVATKPGDSDGIAVGSGNNAVVLCKANESFAITGDDPSNFQMNKIADDGALTFECTTTWNGAVIWVGTTGIWMYDGVNEPVNIIKDSLGARWKELTVAFDRQSIAGDSGSYLLNQARCFVYKDYLFVNVTNTGNQHLTYIDGVAQACNPVQLMIYLPTMACTYISNFNFQCFLQIGNKGYVILPQHSSVTHYWFSVDSLFLQGAATFDAILTANSYRSPDLANDNETYIMAWAGRDNSSGMVDGHGHLGMNFDNTNASSAYAGPLVTGIIGGGGWDVNENGHVLGDLPGAGVDNSFTQANPSDAHMWFFGLGNAASVGIKTTTLQARLAYSGTTLSGTATTYGSIGGGAPSAGDLMTLFIAVGENATITNYSGLTAQGWVLRYNDATPKPNTFTGYMFTKVCNGTEGAFYQPAQVTLSGSVCWTMSLGRLGTPSSTYLYPIDDGATVYDTEHVGGTNGFKYYSTRHGYSSSPVGLSASIGPWFHMESRKYDAGDGLWKKSWKQLAIEFKETSSKRMYLETVAGLNTTGVRAVLPYTGTGAFLAARVKFRTRNQYMGFRLYEDISNRPSTLQVGAWQWGYKYARRGAV